MNIEDAQTCPIGGSNKEDIKISVRGKSPLKYRVGCYCGLCGPWEPSIDLAIETWNRIRVK